jgi:threonylcarbamoyladenosine tRNA methylthiotransferase MtaB
MTAIILNLTKTIQPFAQSANSFIYADNFVNKFFIYTFGCKVNRYETQLIVQKLKAQNFICAPTPKEADLIIFNSCSVTSQADKECLRFIRKSLKLSHHPKIILTGCMANNLPNDVLDEVEIIKDKSSLFSDPIKQTIENFDGRSRAFVKIQDGCDSFCSYCIVPYVRNVLWSKPKDLVLSEIKNLVLKGFSEIVLTGIHIGKYEWGLSSLLSDIIDLDLNFRVRLSSIELNEIDEDLLNLMIKNPQKICAHLHIPLQSASDKILKLMNRKYSAADYERKILELSKSMPQLCISTDIITGFPQETLDDHQLTLDFIADSPIARLHVFRYSDREQTAASKFPNKVDPQEIKRRSKTLMVLDALKRKEFLVKNIGKVRGAVYIGGGKALSDNYITINDVPKRAGIFEMIISEKRFSNFQNP